MSSSQGKIPGNIITQVPRQQDSSDEEGEYQDYEKPSRSLFQRLCCCFYPDRSEIYEDDELSAKDIPFQTDDLPLLPPPNPESAGLKCLVLDLDETLLHSSFKPIPNPDFVVPVEIEDQVHKVYVLKRPGVDQFLQAVGPLFEVIVFTASLSKYADPVLDLLDIHQVIQHRLFRESCTNYKGNFVKDLGRLGRDVRQTMIVENSPLSYLFHPENAIPCETWYDDPNDTELLQFIPIMEKLAKADDAIIFLESIRKKDGRIL